MSVKGKSVVVTGGSRGLGLGLVEAFAANGAKVTVVARGAEALESVRDRLGVDVIAADVTDKAAAHRILAEVRPDILVLNAGTPPPMSRLDQMDWTDFSATWETDVKGGLYWIQAAINAPLQEGSRVLVGSSGAALTGSPMSGGYGGAKRMLWMMANYANGLSDQMKLGIRFQTIVPRQMVGGTGTGDAGSIAYSRAKGITQQEFLDGFGAPMSPRAYGDYVISILENDVYSDALAFAINGEAGVTVLERETA